MPTEQKKPVEKTKYHVLRQTKTARSTAAESGGTSSSASPYATFELVAEEIAANGDQHAIRLYVEAAAAKTSPVADDHSALYVAVPSRSWRVTPVEVKTERRVLVGS